MAPSLVVAVFASLSLTAAASEDQSNAGTFNGNEDSTASLAAEQALKARDLWHGKIYRTNTEVVIDDRVTPARRYALYTFYRYEGNLAILVTLDLAHMTITQVDARPNMPTSLAPAEIADAEKIARADPNVKKTLALYKHLDKIDVDTVVAQIINPEVPGFHHRVARLFFRDARRNYLSNVPMVDVDLTTGEVRLDVIRGKHDGGEINRR